MGGRQDRGMFELSQRKAYLIQRRPYRNRAIGFTWLEKGRKGRDVREGREKKKYSRETSIEG